MEEYFLTCPRGLEEVTSNQIVKHIKNKPSLKKGGISFEGDITTMYKVNLHSRTGMHLLKKIHSFKIKEDKDLYSNIYTFNWTKLIGADKTFSIKTKSQSSLFNNTNYVTLKIKDTIVDRIRKDIE